MKQMVEVERTMPAELQLLMQQIEAKRQHAKDAENTKLAELEIQKQQIYIQKQ